MVSAVVPSTPAPRGPRRGLLVSLVGWSLLGACERNEPDRGAASVASHAAAPAESSAAPPPAGKRCEVPLAKAPPPRALPARNCPKDPGTQPVLPRAWVAFPDAPGQPRVAVEVADTPASRERGLMYRTAMPEDHGMIFSWEDAVERSFWMHDTCIPLDMLYVGPDGVIAGILEQVPPLDETARGVPCPAAHVVEVVAGYARSHGILPGQRIHVES